MSRKLIPFTLKELVKNLVPQKKNIALTQTHFRAHQKLTHHRHLNYILSFCSGIWLRMDVL